MCYLSNGWPFIHEFIVVQHFSRIGSDALKHVQAWWFYLPVLAGALLPWTPLLGLGAPREWLRDRRRLVLLLWAGVVLLFSISLNKLAGYRSCPHCRR